MYSKQVKSQKNFNLLIIYINKNKKIVYGKITKNFFFFFFHFDLV